MIYRHEARGADQAITDAIDSYVQAERADDKCDDGSAGVVSWRVRQVIAHEP
jgi:hypothetical protein